MTTSTAYPTLTRPRGQTAAYWRRPGGGCCVLAYLLLFSQRRRRGRRGRHQQSADAGRHSLRRRAGLRLPRATVRLGPRLSGSAGMQAQQQLLSRALSRSWAARSACRSFACAIRWTGEPVPMANMIVEWHPERQERILLCAHYDTRPFPDRDPRNPRGTFVGANDGASGTALLMELAPPDGRSWTANWASTSCCSTARSSSFSEGRSLLLGSEYFATPTTPAQKPGPYRYRWGVLLDMVADADLQIYPDRHSLSWDDTRPLVGQSGTRRGGWA